MLTMSVFEPMISLFEANKKRKEKQYGQQMTGKDFFMYLIISLAINN